MLPNDSTALDALPCTITGQIAIVDFASGERRAGERALAVETPLNVIYGGMPFAVMMLSPCDLEDFVIGFSLTEGVISSVADVRSIGVERDPAGLKVNVTLAPEHMQAHLARTRTMAGRTGCGVCGISDLAALPRRHGPVEKHLAVTFEAVEKALAGLGEAQVLDRDTRAMHAAAWCDAEGSVLLAREDVGRHNALDKLIGALMRRGVDPASGFVLITSRASFEMVEKTAVFGASCLVAVSAPTSLAVERARAHGLTLMGVARADGLLVFHEGGAGPIPAGAQR